MSVNEPTACPGITDWEQWLRGDTEENASLPLIQHLEDCQSCQRVVEQLAQPGDSWESLARRVARRQEAGTAPPTPLVDAIQHLKRRPNDRPDDRPEVSPDLPPGFLSPAIGPEHLGRLGDYDVFEEIGRGAMGIVLRAFDRRLHRVVAIKVLSAPLAGNPLARQRFVREGHSAAAICHENVVAIYGVGESAGLPYLVMQYVAGKTLQDRILASGSLKPAEIMRIGIQAAAGLAAAHTQGLVHRDIKPANLLLENGVERVKLTDFGLARAVDDASITQTGAIAGTPEFMAPEQARGEPIDARADLFSLGCVLYMLCTGRPPFRGSSMPAVLKRICEDTPRAIREQNPEIPDWLAAIVNQLMAKRPEERFSSASELCELLAQCLAHYQQPSTNPLPARAAALTESQRPPPAPRPPARRLAWHLRWALTALIGGAALIFLADQFGQQPSTTSPQVQVSVSAASPPAPVPQTKEVIAELDRIVSMAHDEYLVARERQQLGLAPASLVIDAEIDWVDSQIRRATADSDWPLTQKLLHQLVALRQKQLDYVKTQQDAGVVGSQTVIDAEKKLSEARLRLLQHPLAQ